MPARITMNLVNPNTQLRWMLQNNAASVPTNHVVNNRPSSLNAPMIDRVHKAKPGCSACGKKVA
jgi:hypothetical protein